MMFGIIAADYTNPRTTSAHSDTVVGGMHLSLKSLSDPPINKELKKKREEVLTLTTPEPFFCSSY